MFPIKDWKKYKVGYRFGDKTFYSNFHLGIDIWTPENTPIYAAFDGEVIRSQGPSGGLTASLRIGDRTIRHLHLNSIIKEGQVKEGELIALTGGKKDHPNAGNSTSPHLHLDVYKGYPVNPNNTAGFINPETYQWDTKMDITLKVKVLANNNNWASLQTKLDQVADWYKNNSTNSKGSISLQFSVEQTNFTNIPFEDYDGNPSFFVWGVAKQWQLDNLLPKAYGYDIVVFHMRPEDWDIGQHPQNNGVMLGDFDPYKIAVINQRALENTPTATFGSEFVYITCHEISHAVLGFTGQDSVNGENITHKRFYTVDFVDAPKIFEDLNYQSLSAVLAVRRQGEPMLIINKKSDPNTKFALTSDMKIGFADFPAYQKFIAGRTVVGVQIEDVEFNKIPTSPVVIKS